MYNKPQKRKLIINEIRLFEERNVRTVWNEETEEWYFTIVDVIGVLTNSPNPRKYWSVLKNRLNKEGNQLTTVCSQLKMPSTDGKNYMTDVASTQQLFRLIQSIPSPKAEPFTGLLKNHFSALDFNFKNPHLQR